MASMKKTFWKEYIRANKKDHELLEEQSRYKCTTKKYKEFDQKIWDNVNYMNSLTRALRDITYKKYKYYNSKLSRIFIIGKLYRWYYKLTVHIWKHNGPITIIGKADKNGNVEYPNTLWNRITKLNKFIR